MPLRREVWCGVGGELRAVTGTVWNLQCAIWSARQEGAREPPVIAAQVCLRGGACGGWGVCGGGVCLVSEARHVGGGAGKEGQEPVRKQVLRGGGGKRIQREQGLGTSFGVEVTWLQVWWSRVC